MKRETEQFMADSRLPDYLPPLVEVESILAEQGFAASLTDWEDGGSW